MHSKMGCCWRSVTGREEVAVLVENFSETAEILTKKASTEYYCPYHSSRDMNNSLIAAAVDARVLIVLVKDYYVD